MIRFRRAPRWPPVIHLATFSPIPAPATRARMDSPNLRWSSSSQGPRRPPKWPPVNPYELLGIREPFTDKQLRHAYLEQVRKWHPDASSRNTAAEPNDTARFQQIQDAFELLKSAGSRSELAVALKTMSYAQFVRTRVGGGPGTGSVWADAPPAKPGAADAWYWQQRQREQQSSNHFGSEFRHESSRDDYRQWWSDPAAYQQFYKPTESLTRTNAYILAVSLFVLGGYNLGLWAYSRAKREQFERLRAEVRERRRREQLEQGGVSPVDGAVDRPSMPFGVSNLVDPAPSLSTTWSDDGHQRTVTAEEEERAEIAEVHRELARRRLSKLEQDATRRSLDPSQPSNGGQDRVMFAPGFFDRVRILENEKRDKRLQQRLQKRQDNPQREDDSV